MPILPENSPRLAEINSWLEKQVTVDEAIAEIAALDNPPGPRSIFSRTLETVLVIVTGLWVIDLYRRFNDGPHIPSATRFSEWIACSMEPGDELWRYDTGEDSWEALAGDCGFVILRDGKVFEFWMHLMN